MKTFYGLLISGCLLFATTAFAVTIQDIRVYSALNQPLVADIPIANLDKDQFAHMTVGLAEATEFAQAQLSYFPWYTQLSLTKGLSKQGTPVVRVTSQALITEPTIEILVKFQSNQSVIIRHFTLLFDPPLAGMASGTAGTLTTIPVLKLPDSTAPIAQKPPAVNPTVESPTAKSPLPTPAELQRAVDNLSKASEIESQPLIFMPQATTEVADVEAVLPAWLATQSHQVQVTRSQVTDVMVPETSEATPPKVNTPKLEMPQPSVAPALATTNQLPSSKQPPSDSNPLLWGLLTFILVGGLSWRYRNHLPSLLAKKLGLLIGSQTVHENDKRLSKKGSSASVDAKTRLHHSNNELDPLEEAEVLYKYGRYEQAEAILLAAIRNQEERIELYMKLLEVYGAMNKSADFNQLIADIPSEAYASNPAYEAKIQDLRDQFFASQRANTRDIKQTIAGSKEESRQIDPSIHPQDDIADKISIAKACIERQDYPGAKEILTALVGKGSAEQEQAIQQLFNRLPASNPFTFKPEE